MGLGLLGLFLVIPFVGLGALVAAIAKLANQTPRRGDGRICPRSGCAQFNPGEAHYCRRCGAALVEGSAA
jgi:ribosomal protein L40E